ncbi:MAG TPA: NIPSNAP family protein, partial [Bryobacteraceae bacterium]
MNRRSLIQSVGCATLLSGLAGTAARGQSGRKTRVYRLEFLYLRQGDQGNRINQFYSSQMPLIARNIQTVGVFTEVISERMPVTVVLTGFSSLEEMEAVDARLLKDSAYQGALEEMEKGAEPPFDYADQVLLRATDFSPEIVPLKEKP